MSSKRIQLAERRLAAAEAAYVGVLKAALAECAAGRWGLFGQNAYTEEHPRYRPKALDDLNELAADIDEIRARLGYDPYPLHVRFISMRGHGDENRLGEPKLAEQLLSDLES